jgi:cysteine-rich repeat protein
MKCNGARQALKLKCVGGVWADNGTCSAGENCDQTDGQCHTIIARCQTSASAAFCGDQNTLQTCNADHTATTPTACAGICSAAQCQDPRCGDGKIEASIGETCDDGNLTAADGCEADCKDSTVVGLSAGTGFTCALLGSGAVRCWGDNTYGQLGLADTDPHIAFPYQIATVTFGEKATQIASGANHTCVALAGGGVRCWGRNELGQLGQGDITARTGPAPLISFGSAVSVLSAGGNTTCVVLQNGEVHCWGSNSSGMLGLATTTQPSKTTAATALGAVSVGGTASTVAVGTTAVCATIASGATVVCWGNNSFGQLGRGDMTTVGTTTTPAAAPAPATPTLPSSRSAAVLASAYGHACARLDNGYLECWGDNAAGQLGLGLPGSGSTISIGDDEAPATNGVLQLTGVSTVVAGGGSTCAKSITGGVRCWGENTKGQLGYGDITNKGGDSATKPTALSDLTFGAGITAQSLVLGTAHTCALLSNGEVRCWGQNQLGQLGNGTRALSSPDYVAQTPDQLAAVRIFK